MRAARTTWAIRSVLAAGAGAAARGRRLGGVRGPGWMQQPGATALAAAVLAVMVALPVLLAVATAGGPVPAGGSNPAEAAAAAQQAAARWVTGQVQRSARVGCDEQVCAALAAQGFPHGRLLELGPAGAGARQAAVVVVTPAVRGENPAAAAADQVLAVFGHGSQRVEIRAAAGTGRQLRAGLAARQRQGRLLAGNANLRLTALARRQLLGGQVDPRLSSLIAYLCSQGRTLILAFTDSGPGAGPGVPLRSAVLTGAAGQGPAAQQLASTLPGSTAQFEAPSVSQVRAGSRPALRIEFAAPAPGGAPAS